MINEKLKSTIIERGKWRRIVERLKRKLTFATYYSPLTTYYMQKGGKDEENSD